MLRDSLNKSTDILEKELRKADAAVIYNLLHGWSVMQCNELLFENGLPLLVKEV